MNCSDLEVSPPKYCCGAARLCRVSSVVLVNLVILINFACVAMRESLLSIGWVTVLPGVKPAETERGHLRGHVDSCANWKLG